MVLTHLKHLMYQYSELLIHCTFVYLIVARSFNRGLCLTEKAIKGAIQVLVTCVVRAIAKESYIN